MRELSHRAKGGRSSERLKRLYARRMDRLVHAWEALAARIAVLKRLRVGKVFIGWPKGILRETLYSAKWNGRVQGFWSFDKGIRILQKHLERAGISVERSPERGTSSVCPRCNCRDVVRRPRHVLTCRACGLKIHADQAGSRNILKENKPRVIWDWEEASLRPETYTWNKHRWVDVSNRSALTERLAA
jgi:transposase